MPAARELSFGLAGAANAVWLAGAANDGGDVIGAIRPAQLGGEYGARSPRRCAMLILPCFMRPTNLSSGALATSGLIFELCGVALTQVARVYMGRSFGVLPANRGIVSKGPFRWVRHPIYLGWLILSIGYAMSYPNARNLMPIVATLPFMVWRIEQEEAHLSADREYRRYMSRVRYRLCPGVV